MTHIENIAKIECERLCNEMVTEEWYNKLENEIIAAKKELCSGSGDVRQLLNRYDDLCLKLHCMTEERLYIAGFKHGLETR